MITLVCLHCNHSNLGDAKYCSKCGAGLLRRFCPSCHVANGVGSQFCQDCGAALPEDDAVVPEPTPLHAAPQATTVPVPVLTAEVPPPRSSAWRSSIDTGSSLTVLGPSDMVVPELDEPPFEPAPRRALLMQGSLAVVALIAAAGILVWAFKGPSSGAVVLDEARSAAPAAAVVAAPAERRIEPAAVAVGATAAPVALTPAPAEAALTAPSVALAQPAAAVASAPTAAAVTPAPESPPARPVAVAKVAVAARPAKPAPRSAPPPAPAPQPAPAPARSRESTVVVCTEKVQALGLCSLKP